MLTIAILVPLLVVVIVMLRRVLTELGEQKEALRSLREDVCRIEGRLDATQELLGKVRRGTWSP
jgi:uncharacterized protein YoxC